MILINDGLLSLNLTDHLHFEDESSTEFGSKSNLQEIMLGNYNLFDMMKQFWSTCPSSIIDSSVNPPLVSAVIHKISDNPFSEEIKRGLVLLQIK